MTFRQKEAAADKLPTLHARDIANVKFRLIATEPELIAIADQWNDLVDASGSPELMLRPAWMLRWWKYYSSGRTLCVGAFFDGPILIGLAPLCRRNFRYRCRLTFRRLELLGASGLEADGLCSQYLSLIIRKGREAEVVAAFNRALLGDEFGVWDECVLEMMPGDSPVTQLIADAFANADVALERVTTTQAYFVSPPLTHEVFLKSLSGKRGKWFRKTQRDFEAWAAPEGYELKRATDEASLAEGMRILNDLHAQRWQEEAEDGVFASPRFWAFHSDFAAHMLKCQQLDLMWLLVRGEPVAVNYSFIGEGKVYCYQCGRKVGVPKNVRLGIMMFLFSISDAAHRGLREYDFLGGHSGYKSQFSNQTRPLDDIRVVLPSLKEALRKGLTRAARGVRATTLQLREFMDRKRQRSTATEASQASAEDAE